LSENTEGVLNLQNRELLSPLDFVFCCLLILTNISLYNFMSN
jgi:hypothetical protein